MYMIKNIQIEQQNHRKPSGRLSIYQIFIK